MNLLGLRSLQAISVRNEKPKPVLLGSCKHQTKIDSMCLRASQVTPVQRSQNLPFSRQEFLRCNRLSLQNLHLVAASGDLRSLP